MHNLVTDFLNLTPFLMWIGICVAALGLEKMVCRSHEQKASQLLWRGKALNLANGFIICISIFVVTPFASIFVYSFGNWIGAGVIDLRFFPHYDLASQIISAVLLMFIEDFFYYFYHRAAHNIPALWDIHAVHHSETDMNATTTLRRHWLETPLQEMVVTIPMALLFRLTPVEMGIVAFGRSAFVFFAHTSARIQMGRYSWLLTSPQLHRLHHSCLREHWDSNYAQVFPVFDIMFGSYIAPKRDEFPPTGLSTDERIETMHDMFFWPFRQWRARIKGRAKNPARPSEAES